MAKEGELILSKKKLFLIIRAGLTDLTDKEEIPSGVEFELLNHYSTTCGNGKSWTDVTFGLEDSKIEIGFYHDPSDNSVQGWWYDEGHLFEKN